jgi:high-affinity iron transporter
MKRYLVILLFLTLNTFANTSEKSPLFIVHLLDYLAGDYGSAVQNGKVIAQGEYDEQVEFITTVEKLSQTLPEVSAHPEVVAQIKDLKKKILAKEDAKVVALTARVSQKILIEKLQIQVAPNNVPNFKRGKKLFAQNCISCHGAEGFGDGPDGLGMDPAPANFHDKDRMKEISVFHCYNTVRMGVPGTGMIAHPQFSDKEVWDLATYAMGMRFDKAAINADGMKEQKIDLSLPELSTASDTEILAKLSGTDEEKNNNLMYLRTAYNNDDDDNQSLGKARELLKDSIRAYEQNNSKDAERLAVTAYLEGIEPIEPSLKANKAELLPKVENAMAIFRREIAKANNLASIEEQNISLNLIFDEIELALKKRELSFGVAFSGAFSIILREGFEAVLIVVTLLSVLSGFNNPRAKLFVHVGWIGALVIGVLTWLVSGSLINISGMGQEMIEAVTSVLAVVILLYFGFWLHRQTEITRWKKFLEEKVKHAIDNSNLLALASISFVAVYREAFETVLFVRAIWIQSGVSGKNGIGIGLMTAFVIIFALAILALRYSAKLPMKKLFQVSAAMMCVMAIILSGKAVNAFQATGVLGASLLPFHFNIELLGFYSTMQTLLAQVLVGILSIALIRSGQKKI